MGKPERGAVGFPLGGLILIFLGVLLLLHTLGVVPWGVWGVLWRFWPVTLIFIGIKWPWGGEGFRLEAALSPDIPLELRLKTGASDAQVDLTHLRVSRRRIETGASRLHPRLPAGAGATEGVVKAGAAQVTISVPTGVAARISRDTAVGSFNIDESRFPRVGGVYESPDFATAPHRVDLRVESGVANVEVR